LGEVLRQEGRGYQVRLSYIARLCRRMTRRKRRGRRKERRRKRKRRGRRRRRKKRERRRRKKLPCLFPSFIHLQGIVV
jgi:hypothetical protein